MAEDKEFEDVGFYFCIRCDEEYSLPDETESCTICGGELEFIK